MQIYCIDCGYHTEHKFVGVNPHNEMHLYQCSECDEQQEVEEMDAEYGKEWQDNNT